MPVVLTAIALGGCGSDEGPAPVTEDTVELTDYGVFRMAYDTVTDQTRLDAVFCGLNTPAAAGSIDAQFLTAADSCVVSNDVNAETNAILSLSCGDALPAQTISAGGNLLLSADGNSYAELSQQVRDTTITYTTSIDLPRPPDSLTLNIPGDTFPQFSSVQIRDLQDLVVSSPADGEPLSSDSAIRWTAATDRANSRVLLTASDGDVTVNCSLADDGRFNFSNATQAEMGELFSAPNFSLRRQAVDSPTRGDSGLIIVTSIE